MNLKKILFLIPICGLMSCSEVKDEKQCDKAFPYVMPKVKPSFKVSESMNRVYDNYGASTPQENELYTNFKYSLLSGFDYNNGDGTVTRRDPSRIIKVDNKYYMWYTKRQSPSGPVGAKLANGLERKVLFILPGIFGNERKTWR